MPKNTEHYSKKLAELFPGLYSKLKETPACALHISDSGFEVTVSTFHWLNACVRYNALLSNRLEKYTKDSGRYGVWQDAETWLKKIGATVTKQDNTYNYDTLLDRSVCFYFFNLPGEESPYDSEYPQYVMLWVHQYGDVRGNYSYPAVFEVTDYEIFILGMTNATITNNESFRVWTDDAYHWYDDNTQVPDLAFVKLSDLYPFDPDTAQQEIGKYYITMREAGRNPATQIAEATRRIESLEKDAILKTQENPNTVYYTDKGKGYLNGLALVALPSF